MSASPASYFSSSYADARARFTDAAKEQGLAVEAHINPLRGPDGEHLMTDVVWAGPRDAERVLLTISGTHGAEGYCGSGVQVGTMKSGFHNDLPDGVALMMIHAINPHGFAWTRRVTEDNVDMNRNFVDFNQPLPINAGYDDLHSVICPKNWDEESHAQWIEQSNNYAALHGSFAFQKAVSGGQYTRADGIFYGGKEPTWSHRTLLSILDYWLGKVKKAAIIDYHTGLGPYGYGERICVHQPGSGGEKRVDDWYGGDFTNPAAGTSTSAELNGVNTDGIARNQPDIEWTNIALEYGTLPLDDVLNALRADNWLHCHGDLQSAQGKDIKRKMRAAFYGETDDWKKDVWNRALETQKLALKGLSES
ncbi:M14 family metallopeptidase [Rhodovibrionaceae bacterium A322]